MKHQALFSLKDKSKKNKVLPATIFVCRLKLIVGLLVLLTFYTNIAILKLSVIIYQFLLE